MKKRSAVIAAVFSSVFVLLLLAGRLAGWWGYFTIPTFSNEPFIKPGDHIITSNLKKPVAGSFIVYNSAVADSSWNPADPVKKKNYYTHRICGMPGDELLMKNAVLYVNSINFDSLLNIKNWYSISNDNLDKINKDDLGDNNYNMAVQDSCVLLNLDSNLLKKYKQLLLPQICMDQSDKFIFNWYPAAKGWTSRDFGPIKVPAGHYFVMGDNRPNSFDSRYIGFIDFKDVHSTLLYRF